jgi:hypothetical protein
MIVAAACLVAALASPAKAPDPVKDCPIGLVCYSPAEVGDISTKMISLERDIAISKARIKRFGWTAGCGGGAVPSFNDGALEVEPKIVCGAIWGLRW